jgi:hypothetical protein
MTGQRQSGGATMGLFNDLFGFNITSMDENSIARAVQMGVSNVELARAVSRQRQIEKVEKHNKDIAPTISEAREYEKSFMLVNNTVNRSYGYKLMFHPMMEPLRMNDEQKQRLFDTIADLTVSGSIPAAHAERMKKYLKDMLGDFAAT